jgi:5-methylcytosine-specific restriction endonuclease McrA
MALSMKLRKQILARDEHCWHCGQTEDLVVHHRKNRGMGGSKLLDTPDNLMAICSGYNGEMEAVGQVAQQARAWHHKLPVWEDTALPVFDRASFSWWVLLPDGTKVMSDWSDQPF